MPKNNENQKPLAKTSRPSSARARNANPHPTVITSTWLKDPATQAVFKTLNTEAFQTRAVGGAVRNALLGLPATDIDFATTALPEDVMTIATQTGMSAHPTGLDHGTITIVSNNQTFEVTTLRKDVATDGRRATVAFTTDWTEDANRRDFTINALYCDAAGQVFDPLDGFQDLPDGKVRFIGNPQQRIREDYLRILRFFRFFATFATSPIDKAGLSACISEKAGLDTLSSERIQSEILRLLQAKNLVPTLAIMDDNEILSQALAAKINIDVVDHLIAIEKELDMPPDAILRLAAMTVKTEADARKLIKRLKLSNTDARRISNAAIIADFDKPTTNNNAQLNEKALRKSLYRLGEPAYKDRCLLAWAHFNQPVTSAAFKNALALPQRWQIPKMPFSGTDLLARGFTPGPHIGEVLSQFETWWVDADFPTSPQLLESKLLEFAKRD